MADCDMQMRSKPGFTCLQTYLCERGGSGGHEDLPDSVVELVHLLPVDAEEALSSSLLRHFVLQIPNAVPMSELFRRHSAFGEDSEGKEKTENL